MSDESKAFVERYRPTTFSEIQGNTTAIRHLKDWANTWTEGDPPQMLLGEPGVGKTTTAHVLAETMGWNMLDVNASDRRTTDEIRSVAEIMRSKSFTGEVQLVVLDEVDSLSGRSNIQPLVDQLENPKNPIILIGNVERDIPAKIKNPCTKHEFSLRVDSRRAKIQKINDAEGLGLSAPRVQMLAERKNLRDAIMDLQIFAEQDEVPQYQEREYDGNIFDDIDEILKGNRTWVDEDPETVIGWLDQNLRDRYRGVELAAAFDSLAQADINIARANSGDYRYWRYAGLLAEGVADLRLTEPYRGYQKTNFPSFWRGGRHNAEKGGDEGSLFRKLSGYETGRPEMFSSFSEFKRFGIPALQSLSEQEKRDMVAYYDLSEGEADVIGVDDQDRRAENETVVETEEEETEQNSALAW